MEDNEVFIDFEVIKELGRGSYGVVNECKKLIQDPTIPDIVAIKHINLDNLFKKNSDLNKYRKALKSEIEILYNVNNCEGSEYFMKLYKVYGDPNVDMDLFLVCEKCESNLESYSKNGLSESVARNILRQLAKAQAQLFALSIIHRDLKPENILLNFSNDQPIVKICDFGLARTVEIVSPSLKMSMVGTPYYMPPEKLNHNIYDYNSELYSLGIIFYFMLEGKIPFKAQTMPQLKLEINQLDLVIKSLINENKWTSDAIELFKGLVHNDPTQRISLDQLLKHKYLGIEKSSLPRFSNGMAMSVLDNSSDYITIKQLTEIPYIHFPLHEIQKISGFSKANLKYDMPSFVKVVKLFEENVYIAWILAEFAILSSKKDDHVTVIFSATSHALQYITNLYKNYHDLLNLNTISDRKSFDSLNRVKAIKIWLEEIKNDLIYHINNFEGMNNDIDNLEVPEIASLLFEYAKLLAHEAAFNESLDSYVSNYEPLYWRASCIFKHLVDFCENENDKRKLEELASNTKKRILEINKSKSASL